MWIVRWTLIATIIIVILGLALQNNELVEISIFKWQSGKIPIYLVIYIAFAAGMIVFLLLSVYYQIQAQMDLRRCRREMRRLQNQLEQMKGQQVDKPEEQKNIEQRSDEEMSP